MTTNDDKYDFVTVKNGDWHDPETWKDGKVPPYDAHDVFIKHTVTVYPDVKFPSYGQYKLKEHKE